MGKHVVYLRARDERELEAAGLDPKEWLKELIRATMDARHAGRSDGVQTEPLLRAEKRKQPEPGPGFKPDFRAGDLT